MPDLPTYDSLLEAARNVGFALSTAQVQAFMQLLDRHAELLAVRVGAGRQGQRA